MNIYILDISTDKTHTMDSSLQSMYQFLSNKYLVVPTLAEGWFSVLPDDIRKEIWTHIKDDKTFARACQVNRKWRHEMEVTWQTYAFQRGYFVDAAFLASQGKDWKWVVRVKYLVHMNPTAEALALINGPATIVIAAQEGQPTEGAGIFEGDVVNGKRNGVGKRSFPDGSVYLGCWRDDLKEGLGSLRWSDQTSYSGEWRADKYHGFGVKSWSDGDRYEGFWAEDKKAGKGIYVWSNSDRYEGEWNEDKQHGRGTFKWQTGVTYYGNFLENQREDPNALLVWPNGDKYQGSFKQNMIEGHGVYQHASGDRYIGEWKGSQRHGVATYEYVYGGKFVGQFVDDERNGQGTLYWPEGDTYEGTWRNGGRTGTGKFTSKLGQVYFQEWHERPHRNYAERVPWRFPSEDDGL